MRKLLMLMMRIENQTEDFRHFLYCPAITDIEIIEAIETTDVLKSDSMPRP
jgi:hypothetical protein